MDSAVDPDFQFSGTDKPAEKSTVLWVGYAVCDDWTNQPALLSDGDNCVITKIVLIQ